MEAGFHADVGVVGGPAAVPAAAGPGEGLVNCPGVGVDEAVDTGFHPGLVPTLDKGHGIGLGAAHGVEHQPLRREGTA